MYTSECVITFVNLIRRFNFTYLEHGIVCAPYHAGLSLKKRKEVHEKFVNDELSVVVATVAFGMGIDKPG